MNKVNILSIFGTRPCAIKMAPVLVELENYPDQIKSQVAVTGQHREMLDQVLSLFGIKPDFDLKIMQPEQTLSYITASILEKLDKVLEEVSPDLVLVQGDTPTAFVSALASFYRKIPVGHVEAGLRTFNKYDPFPEEMDRRLIDHLGDYYFAPTSVSKQNLLREGLNEENIFVTGNTVIDALLMITKKDLQFEERRLDKVNFKNRVILVTAHRRESLGETMEGIFYAIRELVEKYPDLEVVFPVHLNPKVQRPAKQILGDNSRIHLLDPLSYNDIAKVLKGCYLVMTDSGGLQEEAPSLGKPVLVLRKTTERPEGIRAGTLKLAGVEKEKIVKEAQKLLDNHKEYKKMARSVNPYGDGKAAQRTVEAILFKYGFNKKGPEEFV